MVDRELIRELIKLLKDNRLMARWPSGTTLLDVRGFVTLLAVPLIVLWWFLR